METKNRALKKAICTLLFDVFYRIFFVILLRFFETLCMHMGFFWKEFAFCSRFVVFCFVDSRGKHRTTTVSSLWAREILDRCHDGAKSRSFTFALPPSFISKRGSRLWSPTRGMRDRSQRDFQKSSKFQHARRWKVIYRTNLVSRVKEIKIYISRREGFLLSKI